jgi:excisionase family DNA binding protein
MKLEEIQKPNKEDWYSTVQVATFMNCSYELVAKLIKSGKIKAVNISRGTKKAIYRIKAEDVKAYYDNFYNKKTTAGEGHTEGDSRLSS